MAKAKQIDYPRGLTFEDVWAGLMETRKLLDETIKTVNNTNKAAEENRKSAEENRKAAEENRKVAEKNRKAAEESRKAAEENSKAVEKDRKSFKETEKLVKETSKQMGLMNNRYGEIVEHIVSPALVKKFRKLGFQFTKIYKNFQIWDENNNDRVIVEIDLILEDGDKVMLVEVKSKPTIEDIQDHIVRVKKVRVNADIKKDNRKFMAAIAGVIIKDNVKEYAFKNGLFVVEPSGKSFIVRAPKSPYEPGEW